MPTRIAAKIEKAAPKLDIENRVPMEETLGGGSVAVRAVAVEIATVLDALAALDATEPDAEADLDEAALSDDDSEVDEDDDDEEDLVVEELEVEVTVDVMVNYKISLISNLSLLRVGRNCYH